MGIVAYLFRKDRNTCDARVSVMIIEKKITDAFPCSVNHRFTVHTEYPINICLNLFVVFEKFMTEYILEILNTYPTS